MSPRRALTLFVVLIVVSFHAPARAGAAPVGDCQAGPGWPGGLPAEAARVVELVNDHRAGRGLAPLAVSLTLTAAADWKSRHMAHYGYMTHDDPAPPAQRTPFERMEACGYPAGVGAGENIAAGHDSPESVMAGWLSSSGHRANIERPGFRAIGVGVARSSAGTRYWTQDFGAVADAGAPPPPPPPPPAPPAPPAPAPPPADPVSGAPARVVPLARVRGCRLARPSRRAVRCRLVVTRGPASVRGALRRGRATVARGRVQAERPGPVRLRLRARHALRPGRAVLRLRAGDAHVRRVVRVR